MRITKYRTAYGVEPEAFDEAVNKLIGEGFQPYCSPYTLKGKAGTLMVCQALVSDEAPASEPEAQGGFAKIKLERTRRSGGIGD